ncbi:patatin family protein [Vibrio alginolyticus]|uniref:patatin-like phospholipase family protein n=1 Tax=Vibrio TaxID=662 RepID=UPI001EEAC87A|nr:MULTISPECIES: patatin family protein [Vibrio]MCG6331675.1 patatin family protein [Vibrio alginolyticus]MCG6335431.1 patatin family protein [Vibrio alginolyticus]MCG6394332.1 patatin family protein [Vibrio alginolyticus]MCQ9035607.1 patatin family protein [Vibrio alginolyticus]MDK9740611.1 patatin family protein [Vibrio sp. B516a]
MEKVGSRALIVEGGAMRGVFSCGILDHFLASEFSPFDSFWGVSAGASNLAAYLAKMPGRNLKIYLDYSLRKEFISPSQLLRGGDMMNLDWMWNVTLEELGIDKSALKADSRPFFLGVTRQDNGQAEYHLPDIDDLAETMKASSALPVLYRNGVSLNGIQYVDGGVSDALPVAEAIKRGAKKIMVLRSQPASYQKPRGKFSALTRRMLKETPGLIEPMLTREVRYNQTLALINNPPPGIEIIQVCPPETFKLKRLSRSPAPLRHAYELGIEAGKEAIIHWSQK